MDTPASNIPLMAIMSLTPDTYNYLAAGTLLIWDILITFDGEVEFIWRRKLNLINVAYLMARYVSLAIQCMNMATWTGLGPSLGPTQSYCIFEKWALTAAGWIVCPCLNAIFSARVFALYGQDKRILFLLRILFILDYLGLLILGFLSVWEENSFPNPYSGRLNLGMDACVEFNVPAQMPNIWIPELVFHTALFILVAIKFVHGFMVEKGRYKGSLFFSLVRDGTWTFILMFATSLFSVLGYRINISAGAYASAWFFTVMAICGSRLILNLRYEGQEKRSRTSTGSFAHGRPEGSEVRFTHPSASHDRRTISTV